MNISSKDRILGNQINQVMNEYDNLNKNLYESKMQYLKRNYPSNYNTYSLNYLNKNNFLYSHYNDPDLQNRITNSLYANNRNINLGNNTPSYTSTLNNFKFMSNYNLDQPSYSQNVIDDFKTTLKQSQALANKIMSKRNFYPNKNNNFNNYKFNLNINTDYDNSDISINSSINSNYSEGNDSSLNLEEISDELKNIKDNGEDLKYNYIYKKNNNDNLINLNKEEEKLKTSNQVLKKSNQDLRNNNRILEVEIMNYKNQKNSLKGGGDINTHFDESLQKFLNSVKNDFKESIDKKLQMTDKILNFQKDIQNTLKDYKKLEAEHSKIAGKIEEDNRKKAEIQFMNEENEKKISLLTEEKNNLNNELEKIKIELLNLQNTEKNLKLLNESNLKKKKDSIDIITKLKNTINQLSKENSTTSQKAKLNDRNNKNVMLTLNSYDQKIAEMKNLIQKINKEKDDIMELNANMNIELKTGKNNANKENIEKEKKLKDEMNDLKIENEKKKNEVAEKELRIQTLKEYLEKSINLLNNDNTELEIQKLNIEELIKDNEEDEKVEKEGKNLEEIKLQKELKNALNENLQKTNEINQTKQMYSNLLKQKEEIINSLEQGITSTDKIPKFENNSINNNINNIKNNIKKEGTINSIKELNLDSENNNNINAKNNNINNNAYDINNFDNFENNYNLTEEANEMNENNEMGDNEYGQYLNNEGEEEFFDGNREIQDLNDLENNYMYNENNIEEQENENDQNLDNNEYNEYLIQNNINNNGMDNQIINEEELNEGMEEQDINGEMEEQDLNREMEEGMNNYMGMQMGEEMGEDGDGEGEINLADMKYNYENEEHENNDINDLGGI